MTSRAQLEHVVGWLHERVPPARDEIFGPNYRAAVYLTDGTFLPCVCFRNPDRTVDLAIRRFDQTRDDPSLHKSVNYRSIVKSFTTSSNRLSPWDIARVETSRFAIPAPLRDRIHSAGETRMSWISFVGKMHDGTEHWFASAFHVEFFEMPIGYSGDGLVDVFPHRQDQGRCYRDVPFFECFLDGL
jgi:hypothetical protein